MKNVLITGAAKRLGRDLAIHLGEQGFFVWVHYNNSKKEAEEVLQLINSSDGRGKLIQGDISQYSQAKSIAKKIKLKASVLKLLKSLKYLQIILKIHYLIEKNQLFQ